MLEVDRSAALILNVNDKEVARYIVTTTLRRAGFAVIEAATGREALAQVLEKRPTLVVLDVQLPDLSGLEVCTRIRANPAVASTKILHTSAMHINASSKVEALRGGADGYLAQPFESEELLATIDSLLRLSQAEEQLRKQAEQLREADRLKNEFLAMLAHELRNPLAAIWAALPLLEENQAFTDRQQKALQVLERQSGQLRRLIDDLLDASRVTHGKIELRDEKVDLVRLVAQVSENVQRTSLQRRKQTLDLVLPDEALWVRGDSLRLEQVFANMLDNASKYTQEGGNVSVSIDKDVTRGHPLACIEIRDNGIGMSAETLPQIFSLFAQADVPLARSTGGLGIGLTLVHRLVELHGGSVSATSEGQNLGSTFKVCLPLVDAERPSSLPEARRPPGQVEPIRKILLIDDNEDLLELTAHQLRSWGHRVECEIDGTDGLEKLKAWRPDVALIDIGLPGMDGFEVARRARADGVASYLVAVTGYSSSDKRETALESGYDKVMVKPIELSALKTLLKSLRAQPA